MFCVLVIACAWVKPGHPQEVSRSVELLPVRMTYADLARLVGKIHEFMKVANSTSDHENVFERMDLQGTLAALSLDRNFSASAFEYAPPVAYSLYYNYESPNAVISQITIFMQYWDRRVTIKGRSPDQVLALMAIITESLGENETYMSGMFFRISVLLLAAICMTTILLYRFRSTNFEGLIIYGGMFFWWILFLVLPLAKWAPGTAILAKDVPFMQAHSPFFTFIGALAGVLGLIPALNFMNHRKSVSSNKPAKR